MIIPAAPSLLKLSGLHGWASYLHGPQRKHTVVLDCPSCGHLFCLPDHNINAVGSVSPSVVCPHPGCTFHEFVQLQGWSA